MKQKIKKTAVWSYASALTLCLLFLPFPLIAASIQEGQKQASQNAISAANKQLIAAFEQRVKEYVSLRERLEEKLPKLSKDAKPEEIDAHKKLFQ